MSKDIDFKNVRLNNGMTIPEMLKSEANRFVRILQEEIDYWYTLYEPKIYNRTYSMREGLTVSDYVTVTPNNRKFTIDVHFNDNAFSTGLFDQEEVNTLLLLNYGYTVHKDVWFKDIPQFGYREGGHFIESAIARFNKENSLGVEIKLYKGGKSRSG